MLTPTRILQSAILKSASIESLELFLSNFLADGTEISLDKDGKYKLISTRQLVKRIEGMKIEIYSNDHMPPHFHVVFSDVNASFSLDNCELIKGEISCKYERKVRFFSKMVANKS